MLGGSQIIIFLLLALGGALAVGNIAALVNPQGPRRSHSRHRASQHLGSASSRLPSQAGERSAAVPSNLVKVKVGRSLVMIAVGLVIVVWALASLIGG
ncbi:MAG: hypothetical protein F4138_07895 [Acidimicrobiia bacterium]|nr:hypothetical protein [Acidimicrobiia bacterium]